MFDLAHQLHINIMRLIIYVVIIYLPKLTSFMRHVFSLSAPRQPQNPSKKIRQPMVIHRIEMSVIKSNTDRTSSNVKRSFSRWAHTPMASRERPTN